MCFKLQQPWYNENREVVGLQKSIVGSKLTVG